MNLLSIIYLIGAAAVGLIAGMIVELGIDSETIRTLRDHNDKLKLENEALRAEAKAEVIEIIDRRTNNPDNYFTPF